MAALTRCDDCKKLSDEPGVGHIGRRHEVRHYRDVGMRIEVFKDLCSSCVKKMLEGNTTVASEDSLE